MDTILTLLAIAGGTCILGGTFIAVVNVAADWFAMHIPGGN